jgi:hypothetical protein
MEHVAGTMYSVLSRSSLDAVIIPVSTFEVDITGLRTGELFVLKVLTAATFDATSR